MWKIVNQKKLKRKEFEAKARKDFFDAIYAPHEARITEVVRSDRSKSDHDLKLPST